MKTHPTRPVRSKDFPVTSSGNALEILSKKTGESFSAEIGYSVEGGLLKIWLRPEGGGEWRQWQEDDEE